MRLTFMKPRLWVTKDPVELILLGQLELPGFDISDSRTVDQAWQDMVEASSHKTRRRAPIGTWPALELAGPAGRGY